MTIMKGPSQFEFKRISIDTSKHIFTLHGIDKQDRRHRSPAGAAARAG